MNKIKDTSDIVCGRASLCDVSLDESSLLALMTTIYDNNSKQLTNINNNTFPVYDLSNNNNININSRLDLNFSIKLCVFNFTSLILSIYILLLVYLNILATVQTKLRLMNEKHEQL